MIYRKKWLIGTLLISIFTFPPAYAADPQQETDSKKGYLVSKDNYLNIPPDMEVHRVAHNVITPEEDASYLARRLDAQNKQIAEIRSRLTDMDNRLKALETTP